jgi:8-amino-7-oxononanoate synthase
MRLLDKFAAFASRRRALVETGVDPFNVVVDQVLSATEAIIDGRRTILAGTNNYLGLSFDPDCIAAAQAAVAAEGTGTTGSRMANGTLAGHVALERELAEFFGRRGAIVFSTGYLANLGVISALAGRDDVIMLDADCHASIYDGCQAGGAEVIRFRHNDTKDLEKRLRRLGERTARTLIVVEGIYSMLGDRAPLAEIARLKTAFGATLLVDEAHSLGVLEERGLAQAAGVESEVEFITGTFSKSLGAIGGYCVSDVAELDLIRYTSRPYIFTASLSPSIIASTRTALACLVARPELRKRLWCTARQLYRNLQQMGFTLGPEPSPIIAVWLTDERGALAMWSGLMERGVYVNLVFPPATPGASTYLLRCSVSAAHTPEQIDKICAAFSEAAQGSQADSAA